MINVATFGAQYRLKKRADFLALQRNGRKFVGRFIVFYWLQTERTDSRLGVSVSTKVAPRAVDRNRIKRWIREQFRRTRGSFKGAFDIVVIARADASTCNFESFSRELHNSLRRLG